MQTGPACRRRGRRRGRGARHHLRVVGPGRLLASPRRHRAARDRAGAASARPAAGADGGTRNGDRTGRVHARRRLSGRRGDFRSVLRRLRPGLLRAARQGGRCHRDAARRGRRPARRDRAGRGGQCSGRAQSVRRAGLVHPRGADGGELGSGVRAPHPARLRGGTERPRGAAGGGRG